MIGHRSLSPHVGSPPADIVATRVKVRRTYHSLVAERDKVCEPVGRAGFVDRAPEKAVLGLVVVLGQAERKLGLRVLESGAALVDPSLPVFHDVEEALLPRDQCLVPRAI